MDLLIASLLFIFALATGIATNLVANELYDRGPSCGRWLIERAVRHLPKRKQARYREEWLAHFDECPGNMGKLWHAIGCQIGGIRIARSVGKRRRRARTTSKSGSSLRMQLYKFFGFAVSEKREPDEFKSRFWQESFQIRIDKSD